MLIDKISLDILELITLIFFSMLSVYQNVFLCYPFQYDIFIINFDTVIYLIFVIWLAKYKQYFVLFNDNLLAHNQSYKCFNFWFML